MNGKRPYYLPSIAINPEMIDTVVNNSVPPGLVRPATTQTVVPGITRPQPTAKGTDIGTDPA